MPHERILVTGAEGFVGRHLLPQLRAAFPDCLLLPTAHDGRPGCHALDVTDPAAVAALIEMLRPTACIHLAAISVVAHAKRSPEQAWQVNLHGTLAVADAIQKHAPGCLFLFVSSGEIYGRSFAAARPLDETALPAPMNFYAATKAAADLAIGTFSEEGLRAVRVRPFNHTGPGQSDSFVVAAFARQIARIEAGLQPPALSVGSLDPVRDFLDVRDVCAAYVACLRQADALAPGTILNIASGVPRRIGDILAELLALAGIEAATEVAPALLRGPEIASASGDAGRARRMLEWRPQIPWRDTLRAVLDDWRERVRVGA